MLLRADGGDVLAIGQASHAWISGQLARAWGNAGFPAPAPFEEVCLAAEQHDVGMATWDLWPEHNPRTGLPRAFTEMDLQTHLALWSSAPQRLRSQSRYAAVLVSMHGCRLYERRDLERLPAGDAGAIRAYLREQRRLQDELIASLRAEPLMAPVAGPQAIARASHLIWTWDLISLALCLSWPAQTASDVPGRAGPVALALAAREREMAISPWPFALPEVKVRCQGQRLTGRFQSRAAMHEALGAAAWETIEFVLSPGQP